MSEYQFTKDWFNWAPEVWTQLIPMLSGTARHRQFLEIGSFEGRSSIWIAENMMTEGDELRCIDTWQGGEEHGEENMSEVEERFRHNLIVATKKLPRRRIFQLKGTSTKKLAELQSHPSEHSFDFIYIDGSHIAKDVLTDACMAWPLLSPKGLMVFDDYLWTPNARDILHRPKAAIDAFVNLFAEEVEIVHVGYQLVVRKKGE
jgi:predicted O-methyltransferase YrrM